LSPLAEIVPTWAISSEDCTFLARLWMSLTTAVAAISMPRLRSIGFMPAATSLRPSLIIKAVSTVAVVVPSPALSVFEATWRTIWAPIFSNLSSSSISLATVTPSLVMRGAPKDLSRTTLRPLGPSVAFTALLRISTPRSMRSRASEEKRTSLAGMLFNPWLEMKGRAASGRLFLLVGGCTLDYAHDVGLFHDQKVLAIDLDLGAGPFAEQHPVARLDVKRNELAAFVTGSRPHRDHLAFLRLFLGGVGNDDAALCLVLSFDAADDDAVVQWTEFHEFRSRLTDDAGLGQHAPMFGWGLK